MDLPVSAEEIVLPEPIRLLDKYDVLIELDDDISATVHVWVVPIHDPGLDEYLGDDQGSREADQGDAETGEESDSASTQPQESPEDSPEVAPEAENSEQDTRETE